MNIQQEREAARAQHQALMTAPAATGTPETSRDLPAAVAFTRELNNHASLTVGSDWSKTGRELVKQTPLPWDFAAARTGIEHETPDALAHLGYPCLVVAGYVIKGTLAFGESGLDWQVGAPIEEFQGVSR